MSTEAAIPRRIFTEQATREIAQWGDDPAYWRHMIQVARDTDYPLAVEVYGQAVMLTERIDRLTEDEYPHVELEDAEWIETQIHEQLAREWA